MACILIIEDEFPVLKTIVDILSSKGFDVKQASNGLDGLKSALELHPDLVICDIYMPSLDGYRVLKEIRKNPSTRSTPFIFLTARSEKRDLRKGMSLGADDYLTKPFTIKELVNATNTQLEKDNIMKMK